MFKFTQFFKNAKQNVTDIVKRVEKSKTYQKAYKKDAKE